MRDTPSVICDKRGDRTREETLKQANPFTIWYFVIDNSSSKHFLTFKVNFCTMPEPVPSKKTRAGDSSLATVASPTTEENIDDVEKYG